MLRDFKLARPEGEGLHPYLNADGAFIGEGAPLLAKDSFGDCAPRPQERLEAILSAGYGVRVDLASRMGGLAALAKALNRGDPASAAMLLLQLQLPALTDREAGARMSKASDLLDAGASVEEVLAKLAPNGVAKSNPNHRGPGPGGGKFTSGEDSGSSAGGASAQGNSGEAAGANAGGASAQGKSYVTNMSPQDILQAARNNTKFPGWLQPTDVNSTNEKECVSLVRAVIPKLPHSSQWKEGEPITPESIKDLAPGTAIATFENGHYANAGKGNHAATSFGPDVQDGRTVGIVVVDQYKIRPAQLNALPFDRPAGQRGYKAGDFSVITR